MQVPGLWSTANIEGTKTYNLYFGENEPFSLLNNKLWLVVSQNDNTLELDAKRGDDGKETVSFSKL
jgi:hypothetical protein